MLGKPKKSFNKTDNGPYQTDPSFNKMDQRKEWIQDSLADPFSKINEDRDLNHGTQEIPSTGGVPERRGGFSFPMLGPFSSPKAQR